MRFTQFVTQLYSGYTQIAYSHLKFPRVRLSHFNGSFISRQDVLDYIKVMKTGNTKGSIKISNYSKQSQLNLQGHFKIVLKCSACTGRVLQSW